MDLILDLHAPSYFIPDCFSLDEFFYKDAYAAGPVACSGWAFA